MSKQRFQISTIFKSRMDFGECGNFQIGGLCVIDIQTYWSKGVVARFRVETAFVDGCKWSAQIWFTTGYATDFEGLC